MKFSPLSFLVGLAAGLVGHILWKVLLPAAVLGASFLVAKHLLEKNAPAKRK